MGRWGGKVDGSQGEGTEWEEEGTETVDVKKNNKNKNK